MSVLKRFLSYLIPIKIATAKSSFNGIINVIYYYGEYRLVAGNLTQSGGLVTKLWHEVLKKINFYPSKVLILGYAGGTAAKAIFAKWPNTSITGVDIDPIMINLGKKYLVYPQGKLNVINADVFSWVEKTKNTYDLIIVDLYHGRRIAKAVETIKFSRLLKKISTQNSLIIFNRLVLDNAQKKQAEIFVEKLKKMYTTIEISKILFKFNWIIKIKND